MITEFNLLISSAHFPFLQQQFKTVSATVTLIGKKKIMYFYYDSIYLETVMQKPEVALCIQADIKQGIIIHNRL